MQSMTHRLLEFIERHPNGVTAKNAALMLGMKQASVAGILSRQHAYERIDCDIRAPEFLYKPKLAAPPIVPLQPGSVAERNVKRTKKTSPHPAMAET